MNMVTVVSLSSYPSWCYYIKGWTQLPLQRGCQAHSHWHQTFSIRRIEMLNHCEKLTFESESVSCIQLFATPWTVACQSLSMEFSRQESWARLPFLSPGDLPIPGIEPCELRIIINDYVQLSRCEYDFCLPTPPPRQGTHTPN